MANDNPYLSNPYESPNPYAYGNVAAYAVENERTTFLRKTYLHVLGAVLALVGLEVLFFKLELGETLARSMFGGYSWILVMVAFGVVSTIANKWAYSETSRGIQYAGLALFTVAEALILLPMLWLVKHAFPATGNEILATAALITTVLFGGLTATIMFTKADMNWMGKYLRFALLAALGTIVVAFFTGISLGLWFSVAMAGLMCGYILYQTSAMMHHMRTDQYVAASLALFSSLATLFWYVLQIVISLQSRD